MADASALKKQCTTAKQKFTRKLNVLSELIINKNDITLINASFDDVDLAWRLVEEKHDHCVDLLAEDDETALNSGEEWIKNIQTSYNSTRETVISLRAEAESKRSCNVSSRIYKLQETNFQKARKHIINLISQNCLPETLIGE